MIILLFAVFLLLEIKHGLGTYDLQQPVHRSSAQQFCGFRCDLNEADCHTFFYLKTFVKYPAKPVLAMKSKIRIIFIFAAEICTYLGKLCICKYPQKVGAACTA